jgi:hypothetical protein
MDHKGILLPILINKATNGGDFAAILRRGNPRLAGEKFVVCGRRASRFYS